MFVKRQRHPTLCYEDVEAFHLDPVAFLELVQDAFSPIRRNDTCHFARITPKRDGLINSAALRGHGVIAPPQIQVLLFAVHSCTGRFWKCGGKVP